MAIESERPRTAGRMRRIIGSFGAQFSLRQRLLFIVLVASLPGMLVALFLAVNALASQKEQIETTAERLADLQVAQHTNILENARILLDSVVETLQIQRVEEAECRSFLSDWIERYPSFTSLTLLDAQGDVQCSNVDSELPSAISVQKFFSEVEAGQQFVVGEYSVGRTGIPLIVTARPVFDESQAFSGAVAVGIDLRWLEFLARRMHLQAGSTITAMDSDGGILNHYRAEDIGEGELQAPSETLPAEEVRRSMSTLGSGVLRGATQAGGQRVYGFQRTEAGGLIIAVGMPEFLEFERYGAALRDTLAAPMAILLLALLAAAYASEAFVTRWVGRLTRAARRMAEGDLDVRSDVPHSRNEIGRLAAAFDSMAAAIQRKQAELRIMAEQRQSLLLELNHRVKNNMQMIVSILRIKGRKIQDDKAKETIDDVTKRITALSEIHNLLYRHSDTAAEANYTSRIAKFLKEFYSSDACNIEMNVDPVPLSREATIPLGLIMNELVANACKHAFRDGSAGTIRVSLRSKGGHVRLVVADNGVPFPPGFDFAQQTASMGMRIVHNMVKQLGGRVELTRDGNWKAIEVEFPSEQGGAEVAGEGGVGLGADPPMHNVNEV